MKSSAWLALFFPLALFASDKEPSLRIETIYPDGTKTVKEMVTPSKLEKQHITKHKAVRVSSQSNHTALPERQRYLALIISKIQQNWSVHDSMRGKQCRVMMNLAPDGNVTSVSVIGGDYYLCKSSLDAIMKVGKFPMSSDPAVYDSLKNMTIILAPAFR